MIAECGPIGNKRVRLLIDRDSGAASNIGMARRFKIAPICRDEANALIERWHRHSGPVLASLDYLLLQRREDGMQCGVGVLIEWVNVVPNSSHKQHRILLIESG